MKNNKKHEYIGAMSEMSLLLSPHEKVLARKFCEMVHEARLKFDEEVVMNSVREYLNELKNEGKDSQIDEIKKQMSSCNKAFSQKLGFE